MSKGKLRKAFVDYYLNRVQNPVMKREQALELIERKMREAGMSPIIESFIDLKTLKAAQAA